MNHYLPPQARVSIPSQDQGMQIWNRTTVAPQTPIAPPLYYHRHSIDATMPAQPAGNGQSWRIISPPFKPSSNGQKASPTSNHTAPSVKHLTCYFWAKNGNCKWSDEECLYAHHDTGKVANGPLQVEPGRPAVAGKNATTARPVYEDWRGVQNDNPARRATIEPVIQDQINYITAKERARRSSSISDPSVDLQLRSVGRTTEAMARLVQQSQDTFREIGNLLHKNGNDLLNLIRTLDHEQNRHLNSMTAVGNGLVNVIKRASLMEEFIQNEKVSLIEDLTNVNLTSLVPEWVAAAATLNEGEAPDS